MILLNGRIQILELYMAKVSYMNLTSAGDERSGTEKYIELQVNDDLS